MTLEVINKQKFSEIIEDVVKEKQISYIDAITWWCEKNEFDPEDAAKLVNAQIKEKIKVEAQDLNFLEKQARLPI